MRITSAEAKKSGYDPAAVARLELAEAGHREADQLRALINNSFVTVPRARITLRVARALDDEWTISDERAVELANEDPETDWREVSEEKTRAPSMR